MSKGTTVQVTQPNPGLSSRTYLLLLVIIIYIFLKKIGLLATSECEAIEDID
jgi:hypothetical protein